MASPLQDLIKQIQDLATDVGNLFQLRGFKTGGTAGQVPVKTNGTDFNWSWGDVGGGAWGTITGTLSAQADLQNVLNAKQVTLVSGTNIKTVNGSSLLGAGDLSIVSDLTSGPVTSSAGVSAIADGALSIGKTSGLQSALDLKLATSTAASTYAPVSHPHTFSELTDINTTRLNPSWPRLNADGTVSQLDGPATVLALSAVEKGGELGNPSSGDLSSCSNLPINTGVSGLGTNVATALAINADATGGIFRQGQALSATTVTASGQILAQSGSSSLPGIAFSADPSNGIYRAGANMWLKPATGGTVGTFGNLLLGSSSDVGIWRNASGVMEVNSGSAGTLRDITLRNLTASGTVKAGSYTVGTTPAHVTGAEILISSVTGATVGAAVTTGGGAMLVKAASNGSAWICTAIIIP